jgi:hypothetical protein
VSSAASSAPTRVDREHVVVADLGLAVATSTPFSSTTVRPDGTS